MNKFLMVVFLAFLSSTALTKELKSLEEIKIIIDKGEVEMAKVRSIQLNNRGLSEFPKQVLKFKNLESLDLSDNGIVKLPKELGELIQLSQLNLSGNQGLSYIDLEDLLEEASFELTALNLSNCELGYLPYQIGRQRHLKKINLSGNLLNSLPYPVIQLTKLEEVDVSNNDITDISWQLSHWWNLKSIDTEGNKNLDYFKLIRVLSTKRSLESLSISHIQSLPKVFNLINLKSLEIANSTIPFLPRYPSSSTIERLTFRACRFGNTEKIVETINEFVKPSFIALHEMPDQDLNPFLSIQTDSISLLRNQLKDIRPLAAVRSLNWVDVRANPVNERSKLFIADNRPELDILYSEPVAENIGIKPNLPEITLPSEYAQVSGNRSSEVKLGSSSFSIPKNAFLDDLGQVYTGPVKLAYTEYMNPTDVFLSGITMTSDSANENLMFSSAGMFRIEAQAENGMDLEMNPQNPVKVEMLSSSPSSEMNIYQLSDEGNWTFKGKDSISEPFKVDMSKVDSAANAAFYNFVRNDVIVTEDRFIPVVKGFGRKRTFGIHFERAITNAAYSKVQKSNNQILIKKPNEAETLLAGTLLLYDGPLDSVRHYRSWFNDLRRHSRNTYKLFKKKERKNDFDWGVNYLTKLELVPKENEDRLYLQFNYRDSLVRIPFVLSSKAEHPKQRVNVFKRFFKNYNLLKRKDERQKRKLSQMAQLQVLKEEQALRTLAGDREAARQKMIFERDAIYREMADRSSVIRSFALSGFGVWNCDRRSRMSKPTPVPREFVLSDNEVLIDTVSQVSIIDYDKNGVLNFYGKRAFFDKGSQRSAIVVFLSATVIGVWKSWKNRMINGDRIGETLELEIIDTKNLKVRDIHNLLDQ